MKVEVAFPVPNKPYGFCGRKATLNKQVSAKKVEESMETETSDQRL